MEQSSIEKMIKEILENMEQSGFSSSSKIDVSYYPLGDKKPELIKTPTNKTLNDITLENVMNGTITKEDVKITPEILEFQAQIAEAAGRSSLARNFRRAAELTKIPDKRILEIYNSLRPFRTTKQELLDIADELENQYGAKINADFVREAAKIYEKRKKLREE